MHQVEFFNFFCSFFEFFISTANVTVDKNRAAFINRISILPVLPQVESVPFEALYFRWGDFTVLQ